MQFEDLGDPEINARVAQYEMAYRMQTSVPEVMDLSNEPESTFELYGAEAKQPGTFAANCLLARRLAERDVRFIQLYHPGWDQHGNLPAAIRRQCKDVDRASYGLITDLKQRGLLDDTLVVWGGEFGRTNYSQGKLTPTDYGRDHHPRCFTVWMAGGGIKPGVTYGATDDLGYNVVENPVSVHDLAGHDPSANWASITKSSPSSIKAAIIGSRMWKEKSSQPFWLNRLAITFPQSPVLPGISS